MMIQKSYFVLFAGLLCGLWGCQQSDISPANQELAFIKYYGHVADQEGEDMIQTSDGGYLMVGSTNSFSSQAESDIYVVKTDALGNEQWSRTLQRPEENLQGALLGKVRRYDEEGVKVVELPDASAYIVAANRTYVEYPSATSPDGTVQQTKIVMYSINPADGTPAIDNGTELESSDASTQKVSDLKLDTASGVVQFIVTGYTTKISTNKPPDPNNGQFDVADIYTSLLAADFTELWPPANRAYGFNEEDYGTSIQILPDGFVVVGTIGEQDDPNNTASGFHNEMVLVKMERSAGLPINPQFYGATGTDFEGGHSHYDASTQVLTVLAHVTPLSSTNSNVGSVGILQVPGTSLEHPNQESADFGFRYYNMGIIGDLTSESLAALPNNSGFILSMTEEIMDNGLDKAKGQTTAVLALLDENLDEQADWPKNFGYAQQGFATDNSAGTVLPVVTTINNTTQSTLAGYVFTGTFTVGTNKMIGLVKVNVSGNLQPE